MQNVMHWSALKTGIGFLPMTADVICATAAASRVINRVGVRVPMLAGPVAIFGAMLWLTRLTRASTYQDVLGPLLFLAVGLGLQFVPMTVIAVRGVRPSEADAASALVNTAQQIGGALGLSVLATIAVSAAADRARDLASTAPVATVRPR